MQEMIKLPDGTWTYSASSSEIADVNINRPDGSVLVEEKPRRKARERKGKP